jgi:glutamate synthase (NADPH/NADH) large chain
MPLPKAQGLYDPAFEHDACGLGFVAELHRRPSHDVVVKGLEILRRLAHRGAAGCDPYSGDGSGILLQLPRAFYERALARHDIELPNAGDYGMAMAFLSRDPHRRAAQKHILEDAVRYHNQTVIAWRDVPVDASVIGPVAQASQPVISQLFIGRVAPRSVFERSLFMIRRRAGRIAKMTFVEHDDFYLASLSSKTVVYKGLTLPDRLDAFYYKDLRDAEVKSSLALVHSRFSTNTFPTWERAHPYRLIAHNGEINTLRGNQTWMAAREPMLESKAFVEHLADFKPIIRPGGSDSASLDNVVDFLVAGGRSLPHVMMMLVPEAWTTQLEMSPAKRAFYEYHAALVEPWDGPAALLFTDGTLIGATLDRNGLRPGRWLVTKSGLVVVASEAGVLDFDPTDVLEKGRLQPGKMFLVDTARGKILDDEAIKQEVAAGQPYAQWIASNKIDLADLPQVPSLYSIGREDRERMERAFGYTREDLRTLLAPMASMGEEATGSMGNDAPLAVLSLRPQLLFRYFKQQFAQVTNPPIDPIREELVMSLTSYVGGEGNLLEETPGQCRLLELPHPILSNDELAQLKRNTLADFRSETISILFDVDGDPDPGPGLANALERVMAEALQAIDGGCSLLILSDRGLGKARAAIPSLLAISAVHHGLIRVGKRMKAGLLVESGEPREVADVALLIGYGAGAVNPYLAFESIQEMARADLLGGLDAAAATKNYVKALKKGLLKILSKMGISTLSSYHGAQIFEAIGIGRDAIARYFPGTPSRLGGIGLREIAREALERHAHGFADERIGPLDVGGVYAWRVDGEKHLWSPSTVANLQKAVRLEDAAAYAEYARVINDQEAQPFTLRGLWDFKPTGPAVRLEEVEPAVAIVRRFATGAMSFGSISKEAHENLAIAMNRIGGKSNSGEGGEDSARFLPDANGDSRRSAIKQVASARFGVTTHYLVNADELQIKIAQGAKPGEGGQLPGHKVDDFIAKVRHATPGVTLISPPPHHDIYSIEDLAQLIFDLKSVNERARVSVKLVSESGVGTIAAGVAKAHADAIHIAGHDGGTGASPLSSIQHAGTPWELGLAETQQILELNGLRARVRLQVDGQLKTGRDVAFAALLGADEFGFATAPLVASGCVMMRKCHLNTCPVGVATQDPVLRARFRGAPEHVINFFFFVAEELRGIMASLGFRTIAEMTGRTHCIVPKKNLPHPKANLLDFSDVLHPTMMRDAMPSSADQSIRPGSSDDELLERARVSLKHGEPSTVQVALVNSDRAFGARLAGELARRHGAAGLPDGTVSIEATGTAGQSFGAFAVRGMLLMLEGEANDYVGKGLSGGVIAIRPPVRSRFRADANVIIGNTVLYGATSGMAFFAGRAGERFAVRNSGAHAVVEGIGDHGCEYMTGGVVVALGTTGRNFGAGMSGGIAYVFDEDGRFASRCNRSMVELEPVLAGDDDELRGLVEAHLAHTRSEKAASLLGTWAEARARFVKVVPTEFKKIMAAGSRALKVIANG